ncbi:MAG: hypothetical protein JWN52_6254, partial [Actinomycetia bacterium]|nr:hypothetical protein [Actinomycetes bacterium]
QSASCIPSGLSPQPTPVQTKSKPEFRWNDVPGAVRLPASRIPWRHGEHYAVPGVPSNSRPYPCLHCHKPPGQYVARGRHVMALSDRASQRRPRNYPSPYFLGPQSHGHRHHLLARKQPLGHSREKSRANAALLKRSGGRDEPIHPDCSPGSRLPPKSPRNRAGSCRSAATGPRGVAALPAQPILGNDETAPETEAVRRTRRSVELWGFEPQTSSMPWRRATSCAIAPRRKPVPATRVDPTGPRPVLRPQQAPPDTRSDPYALQR